MAWCVIASASVYVSVFFGSTNDGGERWPRHIHPGHPSPLTAIVQMKLEGKKYNKLVSCWSSTTNSISFPGHVGQRILCTSYHSHPKLLLPPNMTTFPSVNHDLFSPWTPSFLTNHSILPTIPLLHRSSIQPFTPRHFEAITSPIRHESISQSPENLSLNPLSDVANSPSHDEDIRTTCNKCPETGVGGACHWREACRSREGGRGPDRAVRCSLLPMKEWLYFLWRVELAFSEGLH